MSREGAGVEAGWATLAAGLSRRQFLQAGLAAGALTAGGVLAGCARGGGALGADGQPLLFLGATEAATLAALGAAVIPTQPGFPSLTEAGVIRRIDEELSFVGAALQGDMRAAFGVLEYAPFLYGRWSRYSRLDLAGRREVLKAMMASRVETLRAVGANLKILVHFFYFGAAASWRATGYDGPFSHLPPIASEQRQHYARQTGRVP